MKFFSFDDIKQNGSCLRFVTECLGLKLRDGRCQAVWRGGDGFNVAVSEKEWYDHKAKVGGGLLELAQIAKFPNDGAAFLQTQQFLGEWIGLTPKNETKKWSETSAHYQNLLDQGYKMVKQYDYFDELGVVVHSKLRLEHPEKGKTFLQRTPQHWGMGGVPPILYRLPEVVKATTVYVVEGEKDADTLSALGIAATTSTNGAGNWLDSYADVLAGKNVVVCRDNDEAGLGHANVVIRSIVSKAASVRLICPSGKNKGDVTDWFDFEEGTVEALEAMVAAATPITVENLEGVINPEEVRVARAKELNQMPFSNTSWDTIKGEDGKPKTVESAANPNDMATEIFNRFLGFPKRIGDISMFDVDRDTGDVVLIQTQNALYSWIARKSGHSARWSVSARGAMTKGEFFDVLLNKADRYEEIAKAPYHPARKDVFMHCGALPPPSDGHAALETLANFFSLADPAFRPMVKAFIAAPMFFDPGVQRPSWVIDSNVGQGSGKSTLVNLVSELYGEPPLEISEYDLKNNYTRLVGRLVSAEGRKSRLALLDNVTGEFNSSQLSALITAKYISGQAPYGHGEEKRINNLTYVLTANSANVDRDIAHRSLYITLSKHSDDPTWERRVRAFIKENRLSIFADILDMLRTPKNWPVESLGIRSTAFALYVIQPMCATEAEFRAAITISQAAQVQSDIEDDVAKQAEEIIVNRLRELGSVSCRLEDCNVFIRTDVFGVWFKDRFEGVRSPGKIMQRVRNFAKGGSIKKLNVGVFLYPNKPGGRRGILWQGSGNPEAGVFIVGLDDKDKPAVIEEPEVIETAVAAKVDEGAMPF